MKTVPGAGGGAAFAKFKPVELVQLLEVRVTPGMPGSPGHPGRPDKKDCRFFFADGSEWLGPVTSPSAENKYDACGRKWGLYAIDKVPQKDKPSAQLGQRAHAELEEWLNEGTFPKYDRLINSGALEEFPQPKHPELKVERVFAFAFCPSSNPDDLVVWWGFKDAEWRDTVFDLKSTSDLRWAKTVEELVKDTQAVVYAVDNMLNTGQDSCTLSWVYFTTRGPLKKQLVTTPISWADAVDLLTDKHQNAAEMRDHKLDPSVKGMDLSPNPNHCGDYGGCDYINVCQLKAVTSFMALHKQSKLAKERKTGADETAPQLGASAPMEMTMGSAVLDAMRKKGAAAGNPTAATPTKVPVGAKPTPKPAAPAPAAKPVIGAAKPGAPKPAAKPAPAPAAAVAKPAPKPAPAAAPAAKPVGKLRAHLVKPAEVEAVDAEGVVPPDAPEATVTEEGEELEEQIAEEEAAQEGAEEGAEEAAEEAVEEGTEEVVEEEVAEEPPPPPPKVNAVKKVTAVAASKPAPPPAAKPAPKPAPAPAAKTPAPPPKVPPKPTTPKTSKEIADGKGPVMAEGEPTVFAHLVLYIDCVPVKGPEGGVGEAFRIQDVEILIGPARATVEEEAQMNVYVIEFGNGMKFVAAQLDEMMKASKPVGRFHVSTRVVDKAILDVLMRHADVCIKGGF